MDTLRIVLIPVLLMSGIGVRLIWRGVKWRYLERFIIYVTYPLLMFTETAKMDLTLPLAETILISLMYMGTCFAISSLTSRGLGTRERGTVIFNSTFFNSIFLPFPLIYAFYGDLSVALVFSLPFMVVHNTLGVYLAARWGGGRTLGKTAIEVVTFPPILAFLAGLIAGPFLSPHTSTQAFSALSSIGSLTVYLSLILAGIMIPISRESLTMKRKVPALITVNRLLLSPVFCIFTTAVLGLTGLLRSTFLLMSIMPPAFTNVVIALRFGLDESGTAQSIFVPTFVSVAAAFLARFLCLL